MNRRSFLQSTVSALGATGLLSSFLASRAHAEVPTNAGVTAGDIAILKFLAAAELVEDDLWQQYCELAVNNPKFNAALRRIDPALVRYICDDRDDERSHALLINAYLQAIGETPVNLDSFRTLPSVSVQGAANTGRLTNLTNLTVDTSWYNRYRSPANPDFEATFPQIVNIVNRPTIPTTDKLSATAIQAVAHSAAFHFATIEQGGGSLYLSLMPKVSSLVVLDILGAIGPVEIYHFSAFHKSLERIFAVNAGGGLKFPNLRKNPNLAQAIFPEPCQFLTTGGVEPTTLPLCSVIRPRSTAKAGAVATATGLVQSGIFAGQPQAFLDAVVALAQGADSATRTL